MSRHEKGFFVRHFGLRGVAVFEATKGVLALAGGIAVLTLRHKDLELVAEHILRLLHYGEEHRAAQHFLRFASHVTGHDLWLLFFGVLVYTAVRFVEATGLWLEKEWAEWFAFLSGSLYMPWEIYEIVRHPTWMKWAIFGINVLIVLYMGWLLMDSYKRRRAVEELDV